MGSYDRVDFYRKNRDYGGLLDDDVMAEEEVEEDAEEVYEDDDEGSEQCRSESEEDPEVVREQQEYLKRREKLKELERQKLKQKLKTLCGFDADSETDRKKLPYDNNYGSFFGPSRPVVARRVIEESRARMEAGKIAAKASKEVSDNSYSTTPERRYEEKERPKVIPETKTKAQQLKAARDYSFLFNEDAEIPGTEKGSESKTNKISRPENGQSKALTTKNSKLKKSAYSGNHISSTKDSKGMVKSSRQMPAKVGTQKTPQQKVVPASKPCASDPRNQINKVGSGSVRPGTQGNGYVRPNMSNGTKVGGGDINKKKVSLIRSTNGNATGMQKSVSSKPPQQNVHPAQRKPSLSVKQAPKLVNKVAAKPAAKPGLKPTTNLLSKTAMPRTTGDVRPKKRPKHDDDYDEDVDSGGNYRSVIRQMFGYNPNKYGNVDDDDDRAMEVGFNTIQAEERRSAKIAKEEDERELALIEAEERAERLRAKKRKLQ